VGLFEENKEVTQRSQRGGTEDREERTETKKGAEIASADFDQKRGCLNRLPDDPVGHAMDRELLVA
jgi:hypothetical protein